MDPYRPERYVIYVRPRGKNPIASCLSFNDNEGSEPQDDWIRINYDCMIRIGRVQRAFDSASNANCLGISVWRFQRKVMLQVQGPCR